MEWPHLPSKQSQVRFVPSTSAGGVALLSRRLHLYRRHCQASWTRERGRLAAFRPARQAVGVHSDQCAQREAPG